MSIIVIKLSHTIASCRLELNCANKKWLYIDIVLVKLSFMYKFQVYKNCDLLILSIEMRRYLANFSKK